ncbi:MAG: hypothetical protein AAGG48_24085 [Planctomycetota bacterium]
MSRIAKRIASGILVLAFVAGSVKFGSLAVELPNRMVPPTDHSILHTHQRERMAMPMILTRTESHGATH